MFIAGFSHAIELSPETKSMLKHALEVGDRNTIDTLYTSIMTGNTPQFASLITHVSDYFEQLASRYIDPTSIAVIIDNNATIRDLAMFDYLSDETVIGTIEHFLNTHKQKPFLPNMQLVECYKGLMSLQLIDTAHPATEEESFTQEDLRKAILAIVYYSNIYALRNLLTTEIIDDRNTLVSLYQSLLRISAVLQKKDIIQELITHTPNNTVIKTTLKDVLTTGHTFFQKLYCKNTSY